MIFCFDHTLSGYSGRCAAAAPAADAAKATADATSDLNIFDQYVAFIRSLIVSLHELLSSAGIPYAYGATLFLFTFCVKLLVLPLNWKQMEGTVAMQKLAPRQQKLQKWFGENQQALALETSALYQENKVNPLAGCLPSLAQIPIFIGLYRAIIGLSKDQVLSESFLWIPTLEVRAPTAHTFALRMTPGATRLIIAARPECLLRIALASDLHAAQGPVSEYGAGLGWLTDNWVDGHPALGWHDTICYLTLPVILVLSQSLSMRILTPPAAGEQSEQAAQTQQILKFLPLMIGWFSLSAPAGLGLYWFFNNVITTASSVFIKTMLGAGMPPAAAAPAEQEAQ